MTHETVPNEDINQPELDFDIAPEAPVIEHDTTAKDTTEEQPVAPREQVVLTLEPHIARLLRDALVMACDGKEVIVRTP